MVELEVKQELIGWGGFEWVKRREIGHSNWRKEPVHGQKVKTEEYMEGGTRHIQFLKLYTSSN